MAYETIDFKTDGPVARITLNRPDVRNAFDEEVIDALPGVMESAVIWSRGLKRVPWVSWATVGVEPTMMGMGPAPAIRKALARADAHANAKEKAFIEAMDNWDEAAADALAGSGPSR